MLKFRLRKTAPLPHWTSCEACLCDDAEGEQARASYCLYYGEDLVFRLCEAHMNRAYAVVNCEFRRLKEAQNCSCPTCGQTIKTIEEEASD